MACECGDAVRNVMNSDKVLASRAIPAGERNLYQWWPRESCGYQLDSHQLSVMRNTTRLLLCVRYHPNLVHRGIYATVLMTMYQQEPLSAVSNGTTTDQLPLHPRTSQTLSR
jgi:hypothetical protein